MARRKRGRLLEFFKDLLIIALVLSAVYLTLRTQVYADLSGDGVTGWMGAVLDFFDRNTGTTGPAENGDKTQPVKVQPLRMAVNIAGVGRYGVQYDNAGTARLFGEIFSILGEALGSAKVPTGVTEQVWREALSNQTGIYFDFKGQVPLAALYAWLEAGPVEGISSESARRVLLAEDESGAVVLYYSNETTGLYYACQTADTLNGHLQNAVMAYGGNVNRATFAYEHKKEDGYGKLAPYVMLPGTPVMQRNVYRSSNPIGGGPTDKERSEMVEALSFHPQSNTSYVAGGKQVVREGADTLSIYDNGVVEYHSAGPEEARYPVGDGTGSVTELALAEITQRLAESTVGRWCGEAQIYLMGITATGEGQWQADYGYQLNGAAVQLGEGYAARFIISGGRVTDFTLVLRSYVATGETTAVLPEQQATAAMSALGAENKELSLTYEDQSGGGILQAGWIAE